MHRILLFAIGALAPLLLLCGCLGSAQKHAVQDFSSGSAALAEKTSAEFVRMRDEHIRLNTARLMLAGPVDRLPKLDRLDGPFDLAAVRARVRAVEALQTYGELLAALVADAPKEGLQKAADRFIESVKGLSNDFKKMSDAQLSLLGALTRTVTGWIVEQKRAKAIKRVVAETHPQVDFLCGLLEGEFNPEGEQMAAKIALLARDLRQMAQQAFEEARDPANRKLALEAHALAQENLDRVEHVSKAIARAAGKARTAHATLVEKLAHQEYSIEDLQAFKSSVQDVIESIHLLIRE